MNSEHAVIGGLMIGFAALMMYSTLGRIAGISGITFGFLWQEGDRIWRLAFLIGLVAGPWLLIFLGFASAPKSTTSETGLVLISVSGFLVGLGTRLGNGCTSGHGVCGIARLSPRSMLAVVAFMGAGMIAATFIRPFVS